MWKHTSKYFHFTQCEIVSASQLNNKIATLGVGIALQSSGFSFAECTRNTSTHLVLTKNWGNFVGGTSYEISKAIPYKKENN